MNRTEEADEHGSRSVAYYLGQIFFTPFRTFVYGMEMLLDAVRGVQRAGDRGMHLMTGGYPAAPGTPGIDPLPGANSATRESTGVNQAGAGSGAEIVIEETERMDKDLNDDQLKLIRYKILFVKRDYEHAFPEVEELISDNMDGPAYTAWKVAQFIQDLAHRDTKVPRKWGTYPDNFRDGDYLTGLPEDDKKYLRVFYEVLERYPREKLKYEEDQLKILREIKDRMPQPPTPTGGSGQSGGSVNVG